MPAAKPSRPSHPDLTDRQRAVVEFIEGYREAHGYSPSYSDLAAHFKMNLNAVQGHVKLIVKKGALIHTPGIPRSLVPA